MEEQISQDSRLHQVEMEKKVLLDIMRGLVVSKDLSIFLKLVHQSVSKVIYAENFFIILYNSDTGLFEEVYSVDKFDEPALPSQLENSISAYVFRTGEPLLLTMERFTDLESKGEMKLIGSNSPSWLGVPLKTFTETIGVMVVQDYEQADRYTERDAEFLLTVAGQVAFALELIKSDDALKKSQYRAFLQRNAISRIAVNEAIASGDITGAFQRLTEEIAIAIVVARIGIWLFSDDKTKLKCISLFDYATKKHSSGIELLIQDYPRYFAAIQSESRIYANDAQNDPRTSEFTKTYLEPLQISSMLDAGIFIEGELQGVICLEHIGEKRIWHSDEESFSSTMASIVGQILVNANRKKAEDEIRKLNETLEERVKERTHQLEIINNALVLHTKEIEQFTFIASHDLQEPLRTITNFTHLIQEEYGNKLEGDGKKYIEFITRSATRMSALVKGLLEYSLLGNESIKTTVDCSRIVHEVLSDLSESIHESKAVITVKELPRVIGYETEMRMLFQNLVTNAVKFRKKDQSPVIRISAEEQEKAWHFSVNDNGIGIEERGQEKIFIIFKRMQNRNDYEGTGIGLAHCKKIVEMHGGKIWVESSLGKGSTFNFTIPK
jgi:signal transduction histidine kinase